MAEVVSICGKFTNEFQPEYCHSGCTDEDNVCQYKKRGPEKGKSLSSTDEISTVLKNIQVNGKISSESGYCYLGCTKDRPCLGKVCQYKKQGLKERKSKRILNEIVTTSKNIQIKGSIASEPEYCHPGCTEDNPCLGNFCRYKNQGLKKGKSKKINEIITTSKNIQIKGNIASELEYCHPGCTKDKPCFGKVCPYKKQRARKRKSKSKINEIIATSKDLETSGSIATQTEHCHTDCTEDDPCQYKILGANNEMSNRRNNEIIASSKNIELNNPRVPIEPPNYCHPGCSKDHPCFGEVCPYKDRQPIKNGNIKNGQFDDNSTQPPGGTGQQPPGGTGQQPPGGTGQQPPDGTGQQPPVGIIIAFLGGFFLGFILTHFWHIWKAGN